MTLNLTLVLGVESAAAKAALAETSTAIKVVGTATSDLTGKTRASTTATTADAAAKRASAVAARELVTANSQAAGATGNLVAQFNDIGMMMAAGQNPLQLAIQQGSQITQVIGPMGAAGAAKALGGAFLGMLNPISLVTMGVIAGSAALVQWATSGGEAAASLDDQMKNLVASIDQYQQFALTAASSTAELSGKFGSFASEVKGFAEYMKGVALGQIGRAHV